MTLEFGQITFDCDNAAALAAFWSALTEQPVDDGASEHFATVGGKNRHISSMPVLMFIQVPEPKAHKNRVHIDLHADDWEAQAQRAVELGATHVANFDEYGVRWATLRDPEGNEFDIGSGVTP
jgi:uncharacterized glyoxalase superfamily protein PhnB